VNPLVFERVFSILDQITEIETHQQAKERCSKASQANLSTSVDRFFPIVSREQIGNIGAMESHTALVLDPATLIALATLISSLSALIWSVRRKP
jgi:hypothetical protein